MIDELHEAPSAVMYALAITLVIIIGLTLAVFAYDGMAIVKKWNNLCMLEVGKEYAKYGFTYYVPVEMQPGEYVDDTHYMAFVKPDFNDDFPPPKNSQKFGFGYYVPYKWADDGEVILVSNNITTKAYPDEVPDEFYPPITKECPSLGFLNYEGIAGLYLGDGGFLYYASLVPIKVKNDDNDVTALTTVPTKNIVFIKFYPGDHIGQAKMQRIGVVQIGKIPSNAKDDYKKWFINDCNYLIRAHPNNNLIVWWGKDGEPYYIYYTAEKIEK
jgi:hypothetical protein